LAESHSLVGDILLQAGDKKGALQDYQRALQLRQQLVMRDTNAADFQYELAVAHANVAVALRRLSRHDEALVEARNFLRIFADLVSRWPGNFAFLEVPHTGLRNNNHRALLTPDQRDDVGAAFKKGFDEAKSRAARNLQDRRRQEEWANYCSEMAVFSLFFGDVSEVLIHAENAVAASRNLSLLAPTYAGYKTQLARAYLALAAYQLLNRQASAAIQSSRHGLRLDPSSLECQAILAMGYLLDHQGEPARAILLANKDRTVAYQQTFSDAIMDELRRFRQRGLAPPTTEKMEKWLSSDFGQAAP
jgi:tetratricopeptide (TPR) repeat protein